MAGNAEGGGEGVEMLRAAHIPWGGMLRGFPGLSVEEGSRVSPLLGNPP